jgi:hypothetical protein
VPTIFTGMIYADPVARRIIDVRLPPKPGLVDRVAIELETILFQFPDCSVDIINLKINNDARRCGYRFHFVDGKSIARICFETRVSRRAIDNLP